MCSCRAGDEGPIPTGSTTQQEELLPLDKKNYYHSTRRTTTTQQHELLPLNNTNYYHSKYNNKNNYR